MRHLQYEVVGGWTLLFCICCPYSAIYGNAEKQLICWVLSKYIPGDADVIKKRKEKEKKVKTHFSWISSKRFYLKL